MVNYMSNFRLKYRNPIFVLVIAIAITFSLSACRGFWQNLKGAFPVTGTENQKRIINDEFWAQFYNNPTTQIAGNIPIESAPLDTLDATNELDSNLYSDTQNELYVADSQSGNQSNTEVLACPEDPSGINCPTIGQVEFENQESPTLQIQQTEVEPNDQKLDISGEDVAPDTSDTTAKPLIITEDTDTLIDDTTDVVPEKLTAEIASQITAVPSPKEIKTVTTPEPPQEPTVEPTKIASTDPVEPTGEQNSNESIGNLESEINESADTQTASIQQQETKLFRWPVTGRIIRNFGPENDGINLAVPEGTPVKAAENGIVVYSGNELEDFGNLVIVQHENSWISAYAHNKERNVERDDIVKRGDIIAHAGTSGSVDFPQLHFMLRNAQNQPVNPVDYLPKQ